MPELPDKIIVWVEAPISGPNREVLGTQMIEYTPKKYPVKRDFGLSLVAWLQKHDVGYRITDAKFRVLEERTGMWKRKFEERKKEFNL